MLLTTEKSAALVTSIMKETQLNDFDTSSKNVGFTQINLISSVYLRELRSYESLLWQPSQIVIGYEY